MLRAGNRSHFANSYLQGFSLRDNFSIITSFNSHYYNEYCLINLYAPITVYISRMQLPGKHAEIWVRIIIAADGIVLALEQPAVSHIFL